MESILKDILKKLDKLDGIESELKKLNRKVGGVENLLNKGDFKDITKLEKKN